MSTLIPELQKGIVTLLNAGATNSASVVYEVPIYFNHAPETGSDGNRTPYPLIVYNVISSPNDFSMGDGTSMPHKYVRARIQVSVFANEDEYAEGSDILDAVDALLAWQKFTTTINLMSIYPMNEGVAFFEQQNKIWHYTRDYTIFAGD